MIESKRMCTCSSAYHVLFQDLLWLLKNALILMIIKGAKTFETPCRLSFVCVVTTVLIRFLEIESHNESMGQWVS